LKPFQRERARVKQSKQVGTKNVFCTARCMGAYNRVSNKSYVELKCSGCGKDFMKLKGNYQVSKDRGQKNFFCDYACFYKTQWGKEYNELSKRLD